MMKCEFISGPNIFYSLVVHIVNSKFLGLSESRTSIVVVVVVAKIRIAAKLAPAFPLAEVRASLPKET